VPPRDANQPDGAATAAIVVIFIVAIGYGIAHFFGSTILGALLGYREGQLWVLSFFSDEYYLLLAEYRRQAGQRLMEWRDLLILSAPALQVLRWPIGIGLLFGAYWALVRSPRSLFVGGLDLEQLIKVQAQVWRTITPMTRVNPAASTRRPGAIPTVLEGTWQEALSPKEWCDYFKAAANGEIDPVRARDAFAKQLGSRFTDIKDMPFHYRALAAVFITYGERKGEAAAQLLGDIAVCWWPSGLKPTSELTARIDSILASARGKKIIAAIATRHGAWSNVLLVGLLHWARTRCGVIAPADWTWLRPVDRSLWYALHGLAPPEVGSVSRTAKLVEAAGTLSHFEAETAYGYTVVDPQVDAAVAALSNAYYTI
jgi:intracellular multiplication protein IcmP